MKIYFFVFILSILMLIYGLYLSLAVYIGRAANIDNKVVSDAILVLGAKSYHGTGYNPCLVSRVTHAVNLYKTHMALKIIVSGGEDKEDHANEAETMKNIAQSMGMPTENIIEESKSTSTFENFLFSKKTLESNNLNSVIIVTEPFHIARASLVAKKLNLNFTVSPAIDSSCWQPWQYYSYHFLREPFALILYKLHNKL